MKRFGLAMLFAAGTAFLAAPAISAAKASQPAANDGHGQAVVTILPQRSPEEPVDITAQDLQVKVGGHPSNVADWVPLRGENGDLELIVLIDNGLRQSIGTQLPEISSFINTLPDTVKVGVAYMENGRAAMAGRLSSDHAQVAKRVRMPNGVAGSSGSPYFCLSDLAQHWPSNDLKARHEVVMITDGVDNYDRQFDLNDPYVQAAVDHAVKAGLVVYSIYWHNNGAMDRSLYASAEGQSLIAEVTQATGGASYWIGTGNPVSFRPYFENIELRLKHQYGLRFDTSLNGKAQIENLNLKVGGPAAKVYAPQKVFVKPQIGKPVAGE